MDEKTFARLSSRTQVVLAFRRASVCYFQVVDMAQGGGIRVLIEKAVETRGPMPTQKYIPIRTPKLYPRILFI